MFLFVALVYMFILSTPFYNHYLFHIFYLFVSLTSFIYHFIHAPIICFIHSSVLSMCLFYINSKLKHKPLFSIYINSKTTLNSQEPQIHSLTPHLQFINIVSSLIKLSGDLNNPVIVIIYKANKKTETAVAIPISRRAQSLAYILLCFL